MPINISTHFPLNCTNRGLQLVDFPFILAHCWTSIPYRRAHEPYKATFAIVDNSVHELGKPLGIPAIASVLEGAPGWIGMLPDFLHNPVGTWVRLLQDLQRYGLDLRRWGIVLQGDSCDIIQFQHDVACTAGVGLICFPYKAPRWDYLPRLSLNPESRYHLMGLNARDDLETYGMLPGKWSLDTGKICKVDLGVSKGWHGRKLSWKGGEVDFEMVRRNIEYLRGRFNTGVDRTLYSRPSQRPGKDG